MNCGQIGDLHTWLQIHKISNMDKKCSMVNSKDWTMIWVTGIH
jgi:hypothetical protein